jgi:hypothetical protein
MPWLRNGASYAADTLTAAAASLGLILIAREIFWGPMTYAMMGGIIALHDFLCQSTIF